MVNAAVSDRRSNPRFVSETKVEVGPIERGEFEVLWTVNISTGGLFVATAHPPALGTRVQVHLSMVGGVLPLQATVVHRVSPEEAERTGLHAGVGLEFTELSTAVRDKIEAYIAGQETHAHEERDLLRQSWATVFPDRIAEAERLVVRAIELRGAGDMAEAQALLSEAIDLDPFNQALTALSAAWRGP